ncbi:hypothetical protein ES703_09084 [subsurface metagenome]
MGFWLHKTFISKRDFANVTSGTEVFNLPKSGILSNLLLELMAYSGSTNADIFMADAISKVEVIGNGSTVIQSLTGAQIQASAAWDDKAMPMDKEISPSAGCYGYFDIRFGRFPGDQKYALDCSKWDSLELKITYDLTAGGALGTTGMTTDTGTIICIGLYSPDGAGLTPVGYLKKAQKKTYVTATDGTEDLALPTDFPYRRLLLGKTHDKYSFLQAWRYITIDINNGARKPIDNMTSNELMRLQNAIAGNPIWRHWKRYYFAAAAVTMSSPIGWMTNAFVGAWMGGAAPVINGMDPPFYSLTASTLVHAHIAEEGFLPWHTLAIDLERQSGKDGVEAMMDCWGYDQAADIHLKHTQWLADENLSVVLEQYASHPV